MIRKKKKVGISFTKTNYKNYVDWFTEMDLLDDVELLELSFETNNTEQFKNCDGFVLTGGVDIHPSLYGGQVVYENAPDEFQIIRDEFEAKIYTYAQVYKKPLLGICRGLQLVNVLEGGKLIQDLGDYGNKKHKKEEADKIHSIIVQKGSLMHQTTTALNGNVNSAHHQSIDQNCIGNNLMASAIDDANETIEAIEFKDKSNKAFMLCIQYHPERMTNKESSSFSQNIKEKFLHAVRNNTMKKLEIINPATETLIDSITEDTIESIENKLSILKVGKTYWKNTSLQSRIEILNIFSALIAEEIEVLAATLTAEVGKPLQQSRNEVNGAISRIQWLTGNAEKYLSDEVVSNANNMEEKISYEPLGIVCNISAWNYPYLVGTNVFVPALLAGNAVFYKPSEFSSLTGLHIERLLKKAGVPEIVFQLAIGGANIGDALLDLPLDGYFFTGSYKTGKYIYNRVAPKMVVCQCELGGKDPLYVTEDVADIAGIAAATADGAFYNNGQSCCSVERIYVHENIYADYVDAFVKEVKSWKVGSPTKDDVYIGPLSRKNQVSFLENQVRDAVEKGATLLTGGKKVEGTGYYFEPTVLVDVDHEMSVMKEESFGPIIGIMKVKDDQQALELMNDTEYGLTSSVYCASKERAENMLKQLNSGSAYWNCCDRVSAALPWSGRKHSGFGTTLSHAGIRAFTKPKGFHLKG